MNSRNFKHYFKLCKFQVVLLITLVSAISMILASPQGSFPDIRVFVFGNLGISLVSIAGGILNHLIDERTDAVMGRTQSRPLVLGAISRVKASLIAFLSLILGSTVLLFSTNTETTVLSVMSLMGYAGVYTLALKKATAQNIVIGGLSGAMPPILGWCAVHGSVGLGSLLLTFILYSWTPPHFWSLSLSRCKEYNSARIPMMPVVYGARFTKLHILIYSVMMVLGTYLPYLAGIFSYTYLAGITLLNILFIYHALVVYFRQVNKEYMRMFRYSIVYLTLAFVLMLTDHFIHN